MPQDSPLSRFTEAPDGLTLHMLDWPGPADATPLVCLPGLARTARDFDAVAARLRPSRRVVALDYRGRGLSERDPDPRHYNLFVENADVLSVLASAGIERATILGTSRGGMHAMLMASTRPALINAVILNDIGPVLEPAGLARIRGYVGRLPAPSSWDEAVDLARRVMSAQFTGLSEADWRAYASATFEERDGRFVARYDPALSHTLDALDPAAELPTFWPQFDELRAFPMLAIRGENSDLLSAETLSEMARRHPHLETLVVAGQGHAPLLRDEATLDALAAFVERTDPT